uniref:Uncharacterized protein n=1 Tax=Rhizophora mucronata TaxID=61149 RepID=A0A2P2N363_RHIMU
MANFNFLPKSLQRLNLFDISTYKQFTSIVAQH